VIRLFRSEGKNHIRVQEAKEFVALFNRRTNDWDQVTQTRTDVIFFLSFVVFLFFQRGSIEKKKNLTVRYRISLSLGRAEGGSCGFLVEEKKIKLLRSIFIPKSSVLFPPSINGDEWLLVRDHPFNMFRKQ